MMQKSKLFNTFLLTGILFFSIQHLSWGMDSEIFSWEKGATQVHCKLKGTLPENNWYAEDVKSEHLTFYQSLFENKTVMSCLGDGQIRTPESTSGRVNLWRERFKAGQPHGGMVIFQEGDIKIPIGHIVAGGGDDPGVSEVAYAYIPEVWRKGIGKDVVKKIVTEWAPEVRRIGLLKNEGFQCFDGKVLKRLDATASPSNVASWKILVRNQFHAAKSGTSEGRTVIEIDSDQCQSLGKVDYQAMEAHILQKYFGQDAAIRLEEGIRYTMTDPEGNERTLSKHKGYNRLKYHFEYNLPQ